ITIEASFRALEAFISPSADPVKQAQHPGEETNTHGCSTCSRFLWVLVETVAQKPKQRSQEGPIKPESTAVQEGYA
uniref:Uncharacterized protein n=1 Tax=Pelusios castaneus TaxID=367368 RepID=A0A8C8VG59_9SAUR